MLLEVLPGPERSALVYRLNGQPMDLSRLGATLLASSSQRFKRAVLIRGEASLDFGMVAIAVGEVRADGFQSIGLLPGRSR